MVNFRPHTISITWDGKPYQDADNNWQTPEGGSFEGDCRLVPSGNGSGVVKTFTSADGKKVEATYKVYLDVMSTEIPKGAKAVVTIPGKTIDSEVLEHFNYQSYSILWL
ncbi:MAG: hypothetical protein CVU09_00210 [Bacteroidetes bacterium HGW-Bacteroidetes-4]|jgi:hypothetical protein|nr:MAG: hypothetical protein CVU09_00210 [Bacteroidetes bacterium HGW-Bacteroidetes-4]